MKTFNFAPKGIDLLPKPERGEVEQPISPNRPGRVRYQGRYWPARLSHPTAQTTLMPGDPVVVMGRDGITLIIIPDCSFLNLN